MRTPLFFFAASLLVSGSAATAQTSLSAGSADWIAEGAQAGDRLGRHVAAAGDVNGDGFDDVLVGARARVHLYLGSAAGLAPAPSWTFESAYYSTYYLDVGGLAAGDVNGDGYDDVAVGEPRYNEDFMDGGRVLLFLGSAAGLSATPSWVALSDASYLFLGEHLDAGDVDGDGFSDLAVLTWRAVAIYRGSATGLDPSPAWVVPKLDAAVESYIAGGPVVGDLDGDGYADLAFSQTEWRNKTERGKALGRLYVFAGSASGPGAVPARLLDLDLSGGSMYPRVGRGGDVDGDGLVDVVVAMEGTAGPVFEPGLAKQTESALLYRGDAGSMLRTSPDTIVSGLPNRTLVTRYVGGAGDLNGDGFGDLIVPESFDPLPGYSFSPVHALPVFFGRGNGPEKDPAAIIGPEQPGDAFPAAAAAAGDVNGDGFDDLIAGAPGYDGAQTNLGRVYLFYGRAAF